MNKLAWYKVSSVPVRIPDDTWYDISDNQLVSKTPVPFCKHVMLSDNGIVIVLDNLSIIIGGKISNYGIFNAEFNSDECQDVLDIYCGVNKK